MFGKIKNIVIMGLCCFLMHTHATTVQFLNKTEPNQPIWVAVDLNNFKKIYQSQIFFTGGNPIVYWKYEEQGDPFFAELDWNFLDTGFVSVYNLHAEAKSVLGEVRELTRKVIEIGVKGTKDLLEKSSDFFSGVIQGMSEPLRNIIKRDQPAVQNNSYKDKVATVRQGPNISPEELAFRTQRRALVIAKQQEMFKERIDPAQGPLEVAIAFSGGGVRALYSTLGALVVLEESGMLDISMTLAALSGSTWALFPWMQGSPANNMPLPVRDHLNSMLSRFNAGLQISTNPAEGVRELRAITDMLLVKFAFDQPVNAVVDLYGALLANKLKSQFGDNRQRMHISDIASTLKSGKYPLPVGVAKLSGGDWFEVTPFECGSRWIGEGGAYVPTWSFGRKFGVTKPGESHEFAPEQGEGFFEGMFGSAIAASLRETYYSVVRGMAIPDFMKKGLFELIDTELGTIRAVWAEVYNPFIKLLPAPWGQELKLRLIDAGLFFGSPVFATYRKTAQGGTALVEGGAPDVILIFDNSQVVGSDELYKHAKYAEEHRLKYPLKTSDFIESGHTMIFKDPQRQKSVSERMINVFELDDLTVPTVVYITRIFDPASVNYATCDSHGMRDMQAMTVDDTAMGYNTFNLIYSTEQASRLAKFAECNARAVMPKVKEVIARRADRRKKAYSALK